MIQRVMCEEMVVGCFPFPIIIAWTQITCPLARTYSKAQPEEGELLLEGELRKSPLKKSRSLE